MPDVSWYQKMFKETGDAKYLQIERELTKTSAPKKMASEPVGVGAYLKDDSND